MSQSATDAVFGPLGADDPQTIAGYRLAAVLGAGGMGKVYLSHTPGGRPVAIKVIRPEFAEDPEFRSRFGREVKSAERVQGLYTAPVIDSDTDGPVPWLATAYVPGPTLAAAVAEHGALPPQTVLMLVAGIAEALQVIHGAGIVHRDLKPSNVLLASDGPRVIDFGIARAADATSLTASGVAVGTPAFMAPEQAAGRQVGPATDVFALGQVAAYAALGAPAYGEGSSHGILYRIVHEEPDLSGLPAELQPLVTRCLAKDPAERPSPAEVLDLCRAAAGGAGLRRPEDWLPAGVAAGLAGRPSVPAPVPTVVPTAQSPAAPAKVPQATQSSAEGQPPVPAAYLPTAAAHPAAPPHPTAPSHHHQQVPPGYGPYAPQAAPAAPGPPPPSAYGRQQVLHSGRRAVNVMAGVFVAFLVLLAGGAALKLMDGDGSSGNSGSGGGAAAADKPRTDPTPAVYQNFQFPSGYHLEFGDDPLQPRNSNYDDIYYLCDLFDECTFGAYNAKIVVLDSGEKGSLETCRSATRFTQNVVVPTLAKGTELCVRSANGNIALLTYKGSSPKSDPSRYVTADITVWRGALRTK
ncbi:serine/threonine-protein kinase [Streptomyces sp. NPDC032472]|uniref:serine/threonine-protein kinase n=1 Tax=Streptomyces sp. NPDC032472 TaxID=3155018 RepID=UPI0033E7E1A6